MDLTLLLSNLGVGVGANAVYDIVKHYLLKNPSATREELKKVLSSELRIEGADIKAEKIIDFLAKRGDIIISGTSIYASDKIEMASSKGTSFSFGENSSSKTSKTTIEAKGNSKIIGTGGAGIIQDEKGNIIFYT